MKDKIERNLVEMKEWQSKYLKAFESNVEFGNGIHLQKLEVEGTYIEWRVLCTKIPLTNYGIVHFNGDVGDRKKCNTWKLL